MPYAGNRAELYLEHLNSAINEFEIDTPQRQAAFLAQIAHESGSLRYVKEIASGDAYEGRKDLGNVFPGDGVRFKGRGLIQITGRANYEAVTQALGADVLSNPELLETPELACRSAAWFWKTNGLNEVADTENSDGVFDEFDRISDLINRGRHTHRMGDSNGWADRLRHYKKARAVLC